MNTISADVIEEIRVKVGDLRIEMASLQEEINNRQVKIDSWQRILDLARNAASQQLPLPDSGRFSDMAAADATEILLKESGASVTPHGNLEAPECRRLEHCGKGTDSEFGHHAPAQRKIWKSRARSVRIVVRRR